MTPQAGETMKRAKPQAEILGAPKKRADGPTPEQLAKGAYGRMFTMHVETATEAMTHVSRHDPVERWKASERLSDGQIAAIELCRRLWSLAGINQRVTANYGERISGGDVEHNALAKIQARADLHRIQNYFPGSFQAFWRIWENVCRHGIAAGIAGGDERTGAAIAFMAVTAVADRIAELERL